MSRSAIVGIILAVLLLGGAAGAFAYVVVSSNEPAAEEPQPARTAPPEPPASQPEPAEETEDKGPGEGQDEDPLAADREAMEELGMEVAEIMTTWDPNEDFNQTAAEMRASALMTEELAESITAPERPTTGEEWLNAAEAGATSQPAVKPNRATSNEVVSIEATWVWVTQDGDVVSNPEERRLFFFNYETGDDGELLVSDYTYETP